MKRSEAYELAIMGLVQVQSDNITTEQKSEAIKILLDRIDIEKLIERAQAEKEREEQKA